MKKLVLLLLLVSAAGFSQSVNQYKYIIVPAKFEAQKKAGQFGLNNLTKMFLEKNGYTVFYDTDILPLEVSGESCNKAYIDVFDDNSLLNTKLRVEIKDCRNAVLFVSDYGQSSEKDNHLAYNFALRSAFRSFDRPEFKYDPSAVAKPERRTATTSEAVAPEKPVETLNIDPSAAMLSAQAIQNGYQLVDTTPKIVMRIFLTSNRDVFIGETDQAKGVVLKKDGQWVFEYYHQNLLVVTPLNIRF